MAHKTSSSESLMGLQRFDDYYLVLARFSSVQAENKLFQAQLTIPATPGAPRIGTTDGSAILLDNVRSADFAKLLWMFYNPKYSLYDATVEDWSTILELACRWEFAEVKSLAVRELEKLELPDIDRIRPELLTVEEGIRLGMETVISLSRARECARNQATRGGRCPSPATLGGTELTEIIKDHFNTMIASAQVFSPRQPPDPRENLRVLQSPLRALFPRPPSAPGSPSPSLAKPRAASASSDSDDNEAETTTLVQGAHPRVVEEARDLVILENVELAAPAPTQDRGCQGGSVVPPPKTPRRQSLHRAVLIRSAQRAVWAANAAATPSSTSNSSSSASSTPTPGPVIRGWRTAPAHASAPSLSPARQRRPPLSPTKDKHAAPAHEDDTDTDADTEEEEAEVRALGLEEGWLKL
ncbi:hypothetical protein B0H11DRAFT_2276039 [Mycena galericulata]|nr:hypothetical protein B0H11DRAFT_2276039 [Mycena galericulata]